MNKAKIILLIIFVLALSCSKNSVPESQESGNPDVPADGATLTDEEIMDLVQEETFKYFWDFAESNSGASRERYHPGDPSNDAHTVATGGTGFGLMALIIGIERGYISREEGIARFQKILDFLKAATRFHGAWPHWIDGTTGNVRPFSPMDDGADLVETAYLAQGLICVQEYLKDGTQPEKSIAAQAEALWKGIEWDWFTQGQEVLYWHWSPNHGFAINLQLKGYNEVLITYVLAAASTDHGIGKDVYTNGWASNGGILSNNTKYGYPLLVKHAGAQEYGGPLFWSHYSFLGLNPKGLSDDYVNYWEVNLNHSRINRQYCLENPLGFEDYGPGCWGLTASYSRNQDGGIGYAAHQPNNDLGVISPTAAISAIPYMPEESLEAMHYFYENRDRLMGPAGFYDAFSPEYGYWVAEAYLSIDQGPEIIMIENHRTGLIWDLFMQNTAVRNGLTTLGFTY